MPSRSFAALGSSLALACAFALGCGDSGSGGIGGGTNAANTGGTSGPDVTGGAMGTGGTMRTGGTSGSGGAMGTGGASGPGGEMGTGGSFVGGAAGTGAGGLAGTGGKALGGTSGTGSGGSTGVCAAASPSGACSRDGDLFCGGTLCCPSASPYYCPATNFCYSTEQKAASACGGSGCFQCVAPLTGTCPAAPTGGSCNGTSSPSYYCGTSGCCGSTNPYFCPANKLCYQTSNQAFAACGGASCIACAPPCSAPPNVTSAEISDEICGGQPLAMIDGIPAFAMCDAALSSNVWSSTGGNTAGVSEGPGWVETGIGRINGKNGYQCTELAMRYFYFRFGICPWIAVSAKDMCTETLPATVTMTTTPVHGDLIILPLMVSGGVRCWGDNDSASSAMEPSRPAC